MITEEQRQELKRLRDWDQVRVFQLEERARKTDNIFVQRWCHNKKRQLLNKWDRVTA